MFEQFRIYFESAALIALCAGSAWLMHHFDATQVADIKLQYATQESARNALLIKQYAGAVSDRDVLQNKINADTLVALDKQKVDDAQTNSINDCLRSGKCRLQFGTNNTASHVASNPMPKTPAGNTPTSTIIDPAVGPDYIALRHAITVTETTLAACQKYAADMDAVK